MTYLEYEGKYYTEVNVDELKRAELIKLIKEAVEVEKKPKITTNSISGFSHNFDGRVVLTNISKTSVNPSGVSFEKKPSILGIY